MRLFFDNKLKICDKSFNQTPQGYLALQGIISRSGEQTYLDSELGRGNNGELITLLRPTEEVTDPMSIASFISMPVTDEHPISGVNPDNFKTHVRGTIVDAEATPSGQVKASMIIYDSSLINKIKNGKRELSAGYSAELEFSDDGKSAIQRKIRGNHVAFVDAARCGKECSIFDSKPVPREEKMAKIKIKNTEYEVADSIAPAITVLIDENKSLLSDLSAVKNDFDKQKAIADAADEKLKKLIDEEEDDEEKAKQIGDAAYALLSVLKDAALLSKDYDPKGKAPLEIKRDIVVDAMPDMSGRSDSYLEARFDIMVEDAKNKDLMADGFKSNIDDSSNIVDSSVARKAANERKRNAWKVGAK